MFTIHNSKIPGCFLLEMKRMGDNRGSFNKTFHEKMFHDLGMRHEVKETYFSYSKKGVCRGMHFQMPPTAIEKIMFCADGVVTDYVVDLRKGSPTFGQWESFELSGEKPQAVVVPKGLAHGFFVHSESAIMQCKSSGVFDPATDVTLSYLNFEFASQIKNPVLSEKDEGALKMSEFNNPFVFEK